MTSFSCYPIIDHGHNLLSHFTLNGKLVPKRCTDAYVDAHGLRSALDAEVPVTFGSVSERIKHLFYGGGFCAVCGARTNIAANGKGFSKFCKSHAHEGKRGTPSHNRKQVSPDIVRMYVDEKKSCAQIARELGGISNVTVRNKLQALGVVLRSRSENQKIHRCRGEYRGPQIVYNVDDLVLDYNNKVPVAVLVMQILDRHGIAYVRNNRTVIQPYEVDFYIPDHKFAIEVNGLYHHSHVKGGKPKNYHLMKYKMCNDAGISLMQLWECDVNTKTDLIESMILNKLGYTADKYNARDCVVKDVAWRDYSKFCEDNHIQGRPGKNSKCVGLYADNALISVLGYRNTPSAVIIDRFCSKRNCVVRGAFTKLMKGLKRPIVTYSSNAIGSGSIYKLAGFEFVSEQLDMFYTDYTQLYNRQKFMKKSISNMPGFDSSLTEVQNMVNAGYDVIYGAGTKTWILR